MKEPVHLCNKKRDQSRILVCDSILKKVVDAVRGGAAADSVLSAIFRSEKRFGSRDRRFLSDTVFAYFRTCAALPEMDLSDAVLISRITEGLPLDGTDFLRACGRDISSCGGNTHFDRLCSALRLWDLPVPESALCFIPESLRDELSEAAKTPRFSEWIMKRPSLWLRANRNVPFVLPEKYRALSPFPGVIKISNPDGAVSRLPEIVNGTYEIQDFSSQCIGLTAAPKSGETWYDVCAGAGGKTVQMLSSVSGSVCVTASDLYPEKLRELQRRVERSGFCVQDLLCRNAAEPWCGKKFDGVLVDAPCSSSGRWRRNPDARFSLTKEKLDGIVSLQRSILNSAANAVRPGGVLVYATCSVFHRENRDRIAEFLKAHPDFHTDVFYHPVTHKKITDGILEIMPWSCDCDASFAARLRRSGTD